MPELSLSETQLKDLMKTVILEVIQERPELVQELLTEAIEDIAMIKAIDEGKESEQVSRETISLLEQDE
ncbi:MAG: hypothetical protein AAGG51_13050 [Cyanobacteria bacterium P01_G01_bin.54]